MVNQVGWGFLIKCHRIMNFLLMTYNFLLSIKNKINILIFTTIIKKLFFGIKFFVPKQKNIYLYYYKNKK